MKRLSIHTLSFIFATLFSACVGTNLGVYTGTNQVAVDTENDRLFVSQPDGVLYTLTASNRQSLPAGSDQPFVSEDLNATASELLPSIVTRMAAFANGTTTLLYAMGAYDDGSGSLVFNRIRVFSFDGASISEASISPVVLDDGDAAADETDNSFADMLIDQDNDLVFVTDATTGQLHVLNAATGAQALAPITIAGRPQGLALDGDRLYVCNSSAVEAEQVITVINLVDFSTTTIDVDAPCNRIAVATSSASGTAMLVRRSDTPVVLIRKVDTATYATSTAIDTTTTDFSSGTISSSLGISSTINDMVLVANTDGTLRGYLSEQDGNLEFITITSDATSYALETISTAALNITEGEALTAAGVGSQVFFVAESGNLVVIEVGSTDVDIDT